jgi:hypothetical protein
VEERALLMKHRPRSVRSAAEIPGLRASTVTQLLHLASSQRKQQQQQQQQQ